MSDIPLHTWQNVRAPENAGNPFAMDRIRVAGGWIYRQHSQTSITICFVPDCEPTLLGSLPV
jgi:hypothetical protein